MRSSASPPSPTRSVIASCTAPTASTWKRFGAQAVCRACPPGSNRAAGLAPRPAPRPRRARYCHARRSGVATTSSRRRRHAHRRAGGLGIRPPSMAVRHRCLAVSRPLGVRVGLSAALRGPSEPAGVLQGTPGNQNSARQTPFLSVADCARSAAPASAWTAIEATRVQSSGCCSEPTAAAGRRTTGRARGSGGGMRTVAPATSGIRIPPRSSGAAA